MNLKYHNKMSENRLNCLKMNNPRYHRDPQLNPTNGVARLYKSGFPDSYRKLAYNLPFTLMKISCHGEHPDERESTKKRDPDGRLALLALLGRHRRRGRLFGPPVRGGHVKKRDLQCAKPSEFRASALGAGIAGFGLGAMLAEYFQPLAVLLILAGFTVHGWGMYRIHVRNR